jgi:uncharacterized protein YqeY
MEPMSDAFRLRQRLRESLKAALSARDGITVTALRSAMSALDNAEAVDQSHALPPTGGIVGDARLGVGAAEVARRELSTQDVIEVIRAEVRDRAAAANEYGRLGRAERARKLKAEAAALQSFLETALGEPLVPADGGAGLSSRASKHAAIRHKDATDSA